MEGEALPPPVVPDRFASVPSRNAPDSTRADMALGRVRVTLALAGRLPSLPSLPSNLLVYSATHHTPHRTAPRCCVCAPASTYLSTLIRDRACDRQGVDSSSTATAVLNKMLRSMQPLNKSLTLAPRQHDWPAPPLVQQGGCGAGELQSAAAPWPWRTQRWAGSLGRMGHLFPQTSDIRHQTSAQSRVSTTLSWHASWFRTAHISCARMRLCIRGPLGSPPHVRNQRTLQD